MIGTKPTQLVVRDFRGTRMYLASLHHGNGMRWHSEKSKALRLTMEEAMPVVAKASREWGAACAVVDANGVMAQPSATRTTPAVKRDARGHFARSVKARIRRVIGKARA